MKVMYCSPCKKIKSNVWYITFFFLVTTPTQLMKLGKFNWKCNWNPLVQTGISTQRFPVDKCDHSDTKKTSTAITVFFSKSYLLSLWAPALMYNGNGGRNQHSNTFVSPTVTAVVHMKSTGASPATVYVDNNSGWQCALVLRIGTS